MNEVKITPELALSAARVIRDFCENEKDCDNCILELNRVCETVPSSWEIPEREVKA